MSLDGNVGIITSEAALVLENAYMSLEGNSGGYTLQATSGQMSKTSETTSSVERGSGWNTSESTPGQMPITSETPWSVEGSSGGKTPEGSSGYHMPMRLSEGTSIQQASVEDFSECCICTHVYARVGKGANGAALTRPLQSVI